MSQASENMRNVPLEKWPFGYFFVDSATPRPMGFQSRVDRCEVHFHYSKSVSATIFFHVIGVKSKPSRHYGIFVFDGEKCGKDLIMAEVDFVDAYSRNAQFHISLFDKRFAPIASLLLRLLHPLIVDLLLNSGPPLQKDGRPHLLWYAGFTQEILEGLEAHYGCGSIRAATVGLSQITKK